MSETKNDVKDVAGRRNKNILIGTASVVLVVTAALIAYFAVKGKQNNSAANASQNSVANSPAATNGSSNSSGGSNASTNATSPAQTQGKFRLIGYFGQNALANGVDLKLGTPNDIGSGYQGRVTDPKNYQLTLKQYCDTGYYQGINIAFMNVFGGGKGAFQITFGSFGDTTYVSEGTYKYKGDGQESNDKNTVDSYLNIGRDIQYCQTAHNIKVVLSLGGDQNSPYELVAGDGKLYSQLFYDMFLGGAGPIYPFGKGVVLDGIEMDIEKNPNPDVWTAEMVSMMKGLRALKPTTLLSAVPQCVLFTSGSNSTPMDQNTGPAIAQLQDVLDYVVVQYYNNPPCSYPFGFNFPTWTTLFKGPIYVGLAGDWTSAYAGGFLEPGPLQAVFDMVKTSPQFGGFSVYDVSSSNPPALNWTVYTYNNPPQPPSQYSKILSQVLSGTVVGSGFPPQGPAYQDGVNNTYRCGSTWVWAEQDCAAKDCYQALLKGGNDETVCGTLPGGGVNHCQQMISKCG